MAEAAAAGLLPHVLFDYTHRMIYAVLKGERLRHIRHQKLSLWTAWNNANFTRAKKLPDLAALLRRLDPSETMSPRAIRRAVLDMASAIGAKITRRKKQ